MFTASLLLLACWTPTAQVAPADDETRVHAAIEAGKRALLEKISPYDEITYTPAGSLVTTKARGTVTRRLGPTIIIKPLTGGEIRIPRTSILQWVTPGHIHPEMDDFYFGGPSALAAFALVSAGVETTNPTLTRLLNTLAEDDTQKAGTYVRSLRACVWSALLDRPISKRNRTRYRNLLTEEATWLMRAMRDDGGYTYTQDRDGGLDNSNTQFANLGLWAASVAGVEVSNKCWLAMGRHWKETQQPAGGWPYSTGWDPPRSSMTVAGCNSLYIVLDRYYARTGQPYAFFKGARANRQARKEMQEINRAIARGDKYLEFQPPSTASFYGYELFGLERLGLASGRSVIGGRNWFRHYADGAAGHPWGSDPIADSFNLIFLTHGQAPVVFQKLEHGRDEDHWNYYHRDLSGLTRYFSGTFERLHRWQRLPANAQLRELQDAPILYLSSPNPLSLSDETLGRIRRYVDSGGTVFLHADLASRRFRQSAVAAFELLFRDYDAHFQALDETHPLYTCHFDCRGGKRIPIQALSDGPRLLVLLCPVDIAGAWHQDRVAKHRALFEFMANVRTYVAPPYAKLPSCLRSNAPSGPAAPPRGRIELKRLPHSGSWNAHRKAWARFTPGLKHRTGIVLLPEETAKPCSAEELMRFDVVHLTTRRALRLDDATLAALRTYLQEGGLLLIDAADGQPDGVAAIAPLLDSLDVGETGVLPADHPIVTGAFPGGRPLGNLETTKAGASLAIGGAAPPILTRTLDGHIAVLACPFDLIAGVDDVFIWDRSGYEPASTARLVDNIFLWQLTPRGEP